MKNAQSFGHAYVRVPLLFLLVLSPIAMLSSVGASTAETTSACTTQKLGAEMLDVGTVVSSQAVQNLASQSSQYQAAVAGYSSTYTGYADEYTIDSTNCTVSWHDAAANFLLHNSKGVYILVVADDPRLGIVYSITQHGYSSASISVQNSATQSGYYIANDSSSPPTTGVTYTTAFWDVPDLYQPPSGQPQCGWTESNGPSECLLDEWTGLENNSYIGNAVGFTGTNVVVQTGTTGNFTCDTHSNCYVKAWGWSEWTQVGSPTKTPQIKTCSLSVSQGDGMSAEAGTEQQINGTSGSYYVTVLIDESLDQSCKAQYSTSEVPTMHYAISTLETPQNTSGIYTLPKFETFQFQDFGMGTGGSKQFGAYPNYNSGWGYGTEMKNYGYQETTTSGMSENCCGSTYGHFTETWDTSSGTPA
jgi:hypothetical protein